MTGFQLLPPLSESEYDALREDIKAHGVLATIDVDETGVILDGHHRQQIATELGIPCPRRVVKGLRGDASKRTYALTVNTNRRHLTAEQRRHLTETSLREDPQLTDREHARRVGISPSTVGAARERLRASGQLPTPETRTDPRGHQHAAPPPRPRPRPPKPAPAPAPRIPSVQLDTRNSEAATGAATVPAGTAMTAESPVVTPETPLDTPIGGPAAPELAEPDELREDVTTASRTPVDERNQWSPSDRRAHEASVRQKQDIEAARDAANNIATIVLSAAGTIVIGCRHGEPNLVTREMVASIRQAADLLEGEL